MTAQMVLHRMIVPASHPHPVVRLVEEVLLVSGVEISRRDAVLLGVVEPGNRHAANEDHDGVTQKSDHNGYDNHTGGRKQDCHVHQATHQSKHRIRNNHN